MSPSLIRKILVSVLMLALIYGIWFLFNRRLNFEVNIYGLDRISRAEIIDKITIFDLSQKSLLQIKPQKISARLLESPLIKSAKTKIKVFPKTELAIYIKEVPLWAVYREAILDDQAKVLIKSRNEALSFNSEAINKLYDHFGQDTMPLVELMATANLTDLELASLKRASDLINKNIDLIASNLDNGSELGPVQLIRVNKINNVFFYANKLKFAAGVLNDEFETRVKRLDIVLPKMIELGKTQELSYVDLSLGIDNVILGKVVD